MIAAVYDKNNIFARILRGAITCKKILETDYSLAFHDINPQAPVHALVITKGAYVDHADFSAAATAEEIVDFARAITETAKECGVSDTGYRLIANCGTNAHQEVSHYHVHILGGRALGRLLDK